MNNIQLADIAHQAHQRIVSLVRSAEATFLELGKELSEFQEAHYYEALGYHSFDSYLADPDTNISQRSAYRLMSIYRTFMLELNLPPVAVLPVGITKLDMIRHVVKDNPGEWLSKAQTLSKADLARELHENGTPLDPIPVIKEWQQATISIFYDVDVLPIKLNAVACVFTRLNSKFTISGELK